MRYVLLVSFFLPFVDAYPDDYVPWALRDHYSFSADHAAFRYDVKSAEWMLDVDGSGALIQDAQCEIEFADGEVLRLSSLRAVKDEREKFSGPMGDGTFFRSVFEADRSLQITFTVARFNKQPFMLFFVALENKGNETIDVRAIRPVVFDPGSISNLGHRVTLSRQSVTRRGIFPVLRSDETASLLQFQIDEPEVTLGLGLLQTGIMNSYIDVKSAGGAWEGAIHCVFEPSVHINPGSKIGSDSIWLSFSVPEPREVLRLHTWAQSTDSPKMNTHAQVSGWITIDPELPVQALYTAVRQWNGANVNHVLVPSGWESHAGSLRGSKPSYPRDMARVAKEIRGLGMRPGITVRPLALENSRTEWGFQAGDGTNWLDVTSGPAIDFGVRQMEKVLDWGFQFLVVETSAIPDEVLRRLNVTRAQANGLALEIAARAARGRPVYPAAELTLGNNVQQWRQAVSATAFFEEFGMIAGPVRLRVDTLPNLPPSLARAIGQFSGPIEFVGRPMRGVRNELNSLKIGSAQHGLSAAR